jgi:hypothetical protein
LNVTQFFLANNISVRRKISETTHFTTEIKDTFTVYWEHYRDNAVIGRDNILASICPQVHSNFIFLIYYDEILHINAIFTFFSYVSQLYGLYIAKLAIAIVLCSGVPKINDTGTRIRSEPHLLLMGDPGTGKSQLLHAASRLSTRSVFTTGIGTTAAGLTAAAVKVSIYYMFYFNFLLLYS